MSFGTWAWIGCALLFILNPWPVAAPTERKADHGKTNAIRWWLPAVLAVIAVVPLAFLNGRMLMALFLYAALVAFVAWPACVLLLTLGPWPGPAAPRTLAAIPEQKKTGAMTTALLLTLILVPLALYARPAVVAVFTGALFSGSFDPRWTGWALDQSTIQTLFWRFTYLAILAASQVAATRHIACRETRVGYWSFVAPVIALFLLLLLYLSCVIHSLIVYVHTLGFTSLRVYGLLYGIACYVALFAFLRWAIRGNDRVSERKAA